MHLSKRSMVLCTEGPRALPPLQRTGEVEAMDPTPQDEGSIGGDRDVDSVTAGTHPGPPGRGGDLLVTSSHETHRRQDGNRSRRPDDACCPWVWAPNRRRITRTPGAAPPPAEYPSHA